MENREKRKKILILHGFMHSARRYRSLAEELKEYDVVCYEFPGFGDTPPAPRMGMLDFYARRLAVYLKYHETDVIIAHSMGGSVALRALERFRLPKEYLLILVNPVYCGIRKLWPAAALFPGVFAGLWLLKLLPGRLSGAVYKTAALLTINRWKDIDSMIAEDSRKADPLTAALLLAEMALDNFRVKHFRGKVCLIVGNRDRMIGKRSYRLLEEDVGKLYRIDYLDTGHTPVVEAFARLSEDIRKITCNFFHFTYNKHWHL